jgi:hypothetical protein
MLIPKALPSPKWAWITSGLKYNNTIKSVIPRALRLIMVCSIIGRFIMGNIGLGIEWVRGWIRVPNPPAIITAFIGLLEIVGYKNRPKRVMKLLYSQKDKFNFF